jgi:hypothetical protein
MRYNTIEMSSGVMTNIYTKFHKDWFRHSKVGRGIRRDTDSMVISYASLAKNGKMSLCGVNIQVILTCEINKVSISIYFVSEAQIPPTPTDIRVFGEVVIEKIFPCCLVAN